MDFTTRKVRERPQVRIETEDLEALYPHNVLLYYLPPTQDITLQMFEELAIERLNILRILEQANSKNLRIMSEEWREAITSELNQAGLKIYTRLYDGHSSTTAQDLEARRRDYLSHFILRLAYCRSGDLKRWFIAREMEWFKSKSSKLSPAEIKKYLEINKLDYQPITEEEKSEIKDGLIDSTTLHSAAKVSVEEFYKVRFTEVPDLVRSRRCFIKGGYAFVIAYDFVSIVGTLHEACIENGLNAAARLLPEIENDERLLDMLKSLHTSYTGKDYALGSKDKVPIECIDQLSKKSFPLCMRQCHEVLRTKHHLRHDGRLQYGLFLKGIGVTLEDSLKFWRAEFTKTMDLDRFEKQYGYNIRYNYGKEGQQKNWSPYSCLKIISTNPGAQDTHGCPFKTLDANGLKAKLTLYGFSSAHAQEVVQYAWKGHYQLACSKYFEIMHEANQAETISHPNQYFDKSQAIIENRTSDGTPKSQKSQKMMIATGKDRAKQALLDEYDDELWNVTQEVEIKELSKAATAAWENDDDGDYDMSQLEDY